MEYNSVSNLNPALNLTQSNFGTGNTSNGQFSFGWTGPFNGLTLPDGDILFFLNVTVLGQGAVSFTDNPTTITAFSGVSFPPDEIPVVTVNQTVFVDDTEPPSITCPANVTVQAPASIVVNNIAPAAVSDNCALPTVGWASAGATSYDEPADPDASGVLFNQGTTVVTYTVTDVAGSTGTCSFEVQVDFGTGTTDLALVASTASASCGAAFSMNISVLNFNQIAGLQFSTSWDTALVEFVSVTNLNTTLNLNNTH
ncbi:MAG: HYR domain-containing protein, partial [Bacteroidota bacterium]